MASVENPGDETSDSAGKHKRALEDGRMAKTPCSKTGIRCPCEETSGSEIQDAHIKGEDQSVGFWVLLNQASDLIWPENHEGPFDKAWRLSSSSSWIYGRIGERPKGMPFAVVKTTSVPEEMSSGVFLYRRYYKGWEKPSGCAAYIWCDGSFPNTGRSVTEMHSLPDFIGHGAPCVVKALLILRRYMDEAVAKHKSIGTFRDLAARTRRRRKNLLRQFSRRKAVTRELRSVLGLAQGTKRKGFNRL